MANAPANHSKSTRFSLFYARFPRQIKRKWWVENIALLITELLTLFYKDIIDVDMWSWKKNWRGISIRNSQHTIHEISRYITRRYTKPIGCIALRDSIFGQFEESTGLCVTRYRGEEVNAPGLSRITPMMYHPSPQWNLVELVFQKVWDSRGP